MKFRCFFNVVSKAFFQLRFVDFLCGVEKVVSMFLALKVVFLAKYINIFLSTKPLLFMNYVTLSCQMNHGTFQISRPFFFFGYHLCIFFSFTFGSFSSLSLIFLIIVLLFIAL